MPFARRVLSHFHTYVPPSSPRNYNALYRTISRRSFSLHLGGFRGVLLVCPGGVFPYALHRGNVAACVDVAVYIAAAWCSLAAINAARAANGKDYISSRVWRNYINIFIYYAKPEEDMRVCDLRANGRFARKQKARGGVCLRACASTACGVLRRYARRMTASGAHPPRQGTPPQGHPVKERRHSPNFFYFFEEEEHKQE